MISGRTPTDYSPENLFIGTEHIWLFAIRIKIYIIRLHKRVNLSFVGIESVYKISKLFYES